MQTQYRDASRQLPKIVKELDDARKSATQEQLRQIGQKAWQVLEMSIGALSLKLLNTKPRSHYEARMALDEMKFDSQVAESKIYSRYLDCHRRLYIDAFYPKLEPKLTIEEIEDAIKLSFDIQRILESKGPAS